MFGHDQPKTDDNQIPDASIQGALGDDGANPPAPVVTDDNQQPAQGDDWGHPGTPVEDTSAQIPEGEMPTPEVAMPANDMPAEEVAPVEEAHEELPTPTFNQPEVGPDTPVIPLSQDALGEIKQKALGDLSPLLEHLDQTAEDRFRTTMMMIQASDNQDLIPKAYEAANAIPDEKAKAQALLDVINEINYFTQHDQHPAVG